MALADLPPAGTCWPNRSFLPRRISRSAKAKGSTWMLGMGTWLPRQDLGLHSRASHRQPDREIVISGDVPNNWLADLKADFNNPDSPTLATEFVGTSISSGGDGADTNPRHSASSQRTRT